MLGFVVCCLCLLGCSEADDPAWGTPLVVTHTKSTSPPDDTGFAHLWYYRTEVRNVSQKPVRIVWFDGMSYYEDGWQPDTLAGHTLRGADFSDWYTEGDPIVDGVLPPGAVAICDANWQSNDTDELLQIKWAYIAVDQHGNDYYVEGVVDPDVLTYVYDPDAVVEDAEAEVPVPVQ